MLYHITNSNNTNSDSIDNSVAEQHGVNTDGAAPNVISYV